MVAPSETVAGYMAQLGVIVVAITALVVLGVTGTVSGEVAVAALVGLLTPVQAVGRVFDRRATPPDERPRFVAGERGDVT